MAATVHSKYDGVNCDPDPWVEGEIFDLIIAIIIAIIEDILDTESTYMKIEYISGNMTVKLSQLGPAEKLTQTQYDDILDDSKDILQKMEFTLDNPLKNWEIIYDNQ